MSSLVITLSLFLVAAATTGWVSGQAIEDCTSTCGELNIPYPFGTSEGCSRDKYFIINCTTSSSGKPTPYYATSTIKVVNISLDGELRISMWPSMECYNSAGRDYWTFWSIRFSQFAVSNTKNKFTVVGCDTSAFMNDFWGSFTTGCTSICKSLDDVVNGTCSGIGCCQSSIPAGNMGYNVTLDSYDNHSQVLDFNPCSYGFVVEDGAYNFSSLDLLNMPNDTQFPVVIDWGIGDENCSEARKNTGSFACMENSYCVDSQNAPGYFCKCNDGFKGNPYLSGSNGCQDINECNNNTSNLCSQGCHNSYGSYKCSCLPGFRGDGFKNGTGCILEDKSNGPPVLQIALGEDTYIPPDPCISVFCLVLGIVVASICWVQRKRSLINVKKKFFEQNGGLMLQEQLSQRQVYNEMAKLFSEEELKEATDDFHESKILGRGGQGTVYKGTLSDNRAVAIKKSRIVDQSQVKDFINEVLLLSRINHKNVVRLLGCCLETEVPLLVYEYIHNNTLLHHIDPSKKTSCLRWETRLRIAVETAGAISYLHSTASIPIIHRDIKSSNILLDYNYIAKVSDFGSSRLVPLDQTQVTTLVKGTLGYLDPEYLQTSQLTEKSDVYSFGVVLMELLTGKKVIEVSRPEEDRNLANYFVSSMKQDRLLEILDNRMMDDENIGQMKEVAVLASRCIRIKGEERPTMKEVAMELEGLMTTEKHPWDEKQPKPKESEYLIGEIYESGTGGTSNSLGIESIRNQMAVEIGSGR